MGDAADFYDECGAMMLALHHAGECGSVGQCPYCEDKSIQASRRSYTRRRTRPGDREREDTTVRTELAPMTANDVKAQVQRIQQVMAEVMTEGQHFGTVPGCGDKPALFKAGAEKIGLTFRLIPTFKIDKTELPNGHREYSVVCVLTNPAGEVMGEGVGCCSTMEKKYRWRNGDAFDVTDDPIPADAKDPQRKIEYRRQGFGMRKVDGAWVWVRYSGAQDRTENPDIADTYNTVLKMAKKRAHVDAIITTTAASDIFTQDVEEYPAADAAASSPKTGNVEKPAQQTPGDFLLAIQKGDAAFAKSGRCQPGEFLAAVAAAVDKAGIAKSLDKLSQQQIPDAVQVTIEVDGAFKSRQPQKTKAPSVGKLFEIEMKAEDARLADLHMCDVGNFLDELDRALQSAGMSVTWEELTADQIKEARKIAKRLTTDIEQTAGV